MNSNFKLSFEIWEVIFEDNDVNKIFNYFLHQILRLFYSTFPIIDKKKGLIIQMLVDNTFNQNIMS
jgi:hypothetical protein